MKLRSRLAWQRKAAAAGTVFELAAAGRAAVAELQGELARAGLVLTLSQERALADCLQDMSSGVPMQRLLSGDVGSGKTLVALLALLAVARSGGQGLLMAPSTLLAAQHHRTLTDLVARLPPAQRTAPALLTGSTPAKERARLMDGLKDGTVRLVVGTTALLFPRRREGAPPPEQPPGWLANLSLAIVDEEQKFGVLQKDTRGALAAGGSTPHMLYMTATPIPRTAALVDCADLALSHLSDKPVGRSPVHTEASYVEDGAAGEAARSRAFSALRAEVAAGGRAFCVYPLREKGDLTKGLRDAESALEELRGPGGALEGLRLDLLTGTMDEGAKQVVMDKFRSGEVQVLVATTVVEVGVDVADATFMLVENAERFGLTVLHQIRGRVGRGRRPGRCHLLWGPVKEDDRDRLAEKMQVLVETADGLEVAERDKEARGAGDVQSRGSAQSGVGGEGVSPAKARGFDGEGVDLSPEELRRLVEESRAAAMRVVLTPSANNHPALAYGLMLHGLQPADEEDGSVGGEDAEQRLETALGVAAETRAVATGAGVDAG